jgi:2-polyprenyl-3-methyl-5-hydroxy-6-metoxy-1,4-benzoquinol methylase
VRPEARAHYEEDASERDRLTQGHGVLEFLRTQELLARHLPVPPARILDVGGAAGIHALPLAQQGYEVDLIDPVELHVRQARDASAVAPAPLRSVEPRFGTRCGSCGRAASSQPPSSRAWRRRPTG